MDNQHAIASFFTLLFDLLSSSLLLSSLLLLWNVTQHTHYLSLTKKGPIHEPAPWPTRKRHNSRHAPRSSSDLKPNEHFAGDGQPQPAKTAPGSRPRFSAAAAPLRRPSRAIGFESCRAIIKPANYAHRGLARRPRVRGRSREPKQDAVIDGIP